MRKASFSSQAIRDPQLAIYAVSGAPAWVWSLDGGRIVWANAAGVTFFSAQEDHELAARRFGPADLRRRQIARLTQHLGALNAVHFERLDGFNLFPGMLTTCACARINVAGGEQGVLIAALQMMPRTPSFADRVLAFLDSLDRPAAAFASNGDFIGANVPSKMHDLVHAGPGLLTQLSAAAGSSGDVVLAVGRARVIRVGQATETALIALLPATDQNGDALTLIPARKPRPRPDTRPRQPALPEPALPEPALAQPPMPSSSPEFPSAQTPPAPPCGDGAAEPAPIEPALDGGVGPNNSPPDDRHDVLESLRDTDTVAVAAEISIPTPPATPIKPFMTDESDFEHHGETTSPSVLSLPMPEEPSLQRRRHPLRFMWQMDADGRFSFGSDEFTRLIGTHTASAFGRLWSDVSAALGLDPGHLVTEAVNARTTFSGIILQWPVDGFGARLPVELSGLPLFDRNREFAGYRGFGICRDLDGLTQIEARRRQDTLFGSVPPSVKSNEPVPTTPPAATIVGETQNESPLPISAPSPALEDPLTEQTPPLNVVPFRPANSDGKLPTLTPGENNAFHEIARQLSERLETEASRLMAGDAAPVEQTPLQQDSAPPPAEPPQDIHQEPTHAEPTSEAPPMRTAPMQPEFLVDQKPMAVPDPRLFEHLPTGVLVYQLDRLIYANPAFLEATGYDSLPALIEAGGLDALYVEMGPSNPEHGQPIVISTSRMGDAPGFEGRLHTVAWNGEHALALMLSQPAAAIQPAPAATAPEVLADPEPVPSHEIQVEELATILETTAEGVVMFDGLGRIAGCNRSAEALFGLPAADIGQKNLIDLFAPESQRALLDYLEGVKNGTAQSMLDHGRDVLGRTPDGGVIPLSVTMGRTRPAGPRYFAVFRDKTPAPVSAPVSELARVTPADPDAARRSSERLANAKADMLSRLSHEIRMPVNAIIGFAEVMIEERFGPLGNERYVDYMKDIRASGERVISIIDDMLDLSRIESGKLDLAFSSQDLNALVEQCVAVMQPQANRGRIIIRSSLTHGLPNVRADARALRQIALNLIGSSIHFANAGGQVIVSTAVTDLGDVALRVRDTGHGLNDNEIAAAMEPFRTAPPDEVTQDNGSNLSLTKALVEANRGHFHIKSAPNTGTLIEVTFDSANATA